MGVITKCETKTDDMVDILTELQKYVPMKSTTTECTHPQSGDVIKYEEDVFHHILFGGDQLTVERIRTAQKARANSNREQDKLMGFIPVVEHWHAEVTLLTVSYTVKSMLNDHVLFILDHVLFILHLPSSLYRSFGSTCSKQIVFEKLVLCINSRMF